MGQITDQRGRVFIVGCPRSGTTLLQSMLAAHPEIMSFPESKFFLFLVSVPEERSRRYALGLIAPHLRSELESFLDEINRPDLRRQLPMLPLIRLYTRYFVHVLDTVSAEVGKSIWVEKTPDHLRSIKHIEAYVPGAKIIHIIRRGEDVIASLYELTQKYPQLWGRYYKRGLIDCINRWIEDIHISRQHLHKPNHQLVHYDQLVQSPREVLELLCSFIGVELDDRMLVDYQSVSANLIRDRESWKASVSQNINPTASQKFATALTPEQQQFVLEQIADIDLSKWPLSS